MRGLTCLYDSLKSITLEYKNQLAKVFDKIKTLLKAVNRRVKQQFQQIMKTVEERVSEAKDQVKEAIEESRKYVENQLNTFKEALRPVKTLLQGAGNFWRGFKSVSFLGLGSLLPDLPDLPDLNIDFPNVKLQSFEELKNWIKSFVTDTNLIDLKTWNDILPPIKHNSIIDIRQKLKGILQGFLSLIQDYCALAKKVFYLSIILIICDAVGYMRHYYSDLSHDNMFVDDNLRELWHSGQKEKITPLQTWELKMKLQYSAAVKLSKAEIKRILIKAIPTLLFSVVAIGVIVADFALSTVLQLFQIKPSLVYHLMAWKMVCHSNLYS